MNSNDRLCRRSNMRMHRSRNVRPCNVPVLHNIKIVPGSKIYQTMFALQSLSPLRLLQRLRHAFSASMGSSMPSSDPIRSAGRYNEIRRGGIHRNLGKQRFKLHLSAGRLEKCFRELVECAELDGAGTIQKFFNIYLPIASPQIFFVIFLNILTSFKSFAMINILAGTGDSELSVLIIKLYSYAFTRERYETGCVCGGSLAGDLPDFRIQFSFEKKVVFYQ